MLYFQLLWVNLIMDTLGALALAIEPPTDHLTHRPPVGRKEPLVTNIMWRNVIIQAIYQILILIILQFRGDSILNLKDEGTRHATKVKNTLIFNGFVFCQIFNEFNARKPDELNVFTGVLKNHLFVGIVGATFVLQIIIAKCLGKFTSTVTYTVKLDENMTSLQNIEVNIDPNIRNIQELKSWHEFHNLVASGLRLAPSRFSQHLLFFVLHGLNGNEYPHTQSQMDQ